MKLVDRQMLLVVSYSNEIEKCEIFNVFLLTATTIEGQARRANSKFNEIFINRPFLFYVRDLVNDVILTAGKIVEITDEEIPVTFTV